MKHLDNAYNSFYEHIFPIEIRLEYFNREDDLQAQIFAEQHNNYPDEVVLLKGTNMSFNDDSTSLYWGHFDYLKSKFYNEIKSNIAFEKNAKSKIDYLNNKIKNFVSIEKNIIWFKNLDNFIKFCLKKNIIKIADENAELDSQYKQEISEFILKLKKSIRPVIIQLREISKGISTNNKRTKHYDNAKTNKKIIEQEPGEKDEAEESKIRYLTKKEVAEMIGVTTRTIDNHIKNGILKYYKVGRSVRFDKKDVNDFLKNSHIRGID